MPSYFVTGATGLLGRNLVERLLRRDATTAVHCLVRPTSIAKFGEIFPGWRDGGRLQPVLGDLTQPSLGLAGFREPVTDFFHVGAVYDLDSLTPVMAWANNVVGTRHAVELANHLDVSSFHHVSSNGIAGRFSGRFFEWMHDEDQEIDHPYFYSKWAAETVVRTRAVAPVRVYRPGIIVGDSVTGAMTKVDGPYFVFKALQQLAHRLPSRLPLVGPEGGLANIVPVDFVADAIDRIGHTPASSLHGDCFHLVDPQPITAGAAIDQIARAAGGPRFRWRISLRYTRPLCQAIRRLPGAPLLRDRLWQAVGVPPRAMDWRDFDATFDTTNASAALAGTGVSCPPFASYVDRLYRYWEAHLDVCQAEQRPRAADEKTA